MAHQDAIFVTFFGKDKEAAMLACDELGVFPNELLYLPKMVFIQTAPNEELALVRYTLRERSRQQTFRKLTALRTKFAANNARLVDLWMHRFLVNPDGPRIPELDATVVERAEKHMDTESDDDEFDEYFRRKPPATASASARAGGKPAAGVTRSGSGGLFAGGGAEKDDAGPFSESPRSPRSIMMGSTSNNNSNNNAEALVLISTPRSSSSSLLSPFSSVFGTEQQQQQRHDKTPELGKKPVPPRQPPAMARVNKNSLRREEKMLDVHKKRLAKFAFKVSTEEQRNCEASDARIAQQRAAANPRASRLISSAVAMGSGSVLPESLKCTTLGSTLKPPLSIDSRAPVAGGSGSGHSGRHLSIATVDTLSSSDMGPIPQLASHPIPAPPGGGGGGAASNSPGRYSRVDADGIPIVGPTYETRRQMQAMLKSSMGTIVESAVSHATWRMNFEREEAEREAREKAKLLLSGRGGLPRMVIVNGQEMLLTPQELFRKREEATHLRKEKEHYDALVKAMRAEERQVAVVHRVEQIVEQQKHRQILSFEAHRMRELLVDQRREWRRRAEEVHLLQRIAKSLPKFEHAEDVRQRKIMSADVNKQAHMQLAMMRKQVKDTLQNMIQSKDWDVPESLSEVLSPELLQGGMQYSGGDVVSTPEANLANPH